MGEVIEGTGVTNDPRVPGGEGGRGGQVMSGTA